MKKGKYKSLSILLMIVVITVFGIVFSFKKDNTNNDSPKKATLVNKIIIEDMIYE